MEKIKVSYKEFQEFLIYLGINNNKYELDMEENFSVEEYIESIDEKVLEELGLDKSNILINLRDFIEYRKAQKKAFDIECITIVGGYNKTGEKEEVIVKLKCGDVISIVGPTGSGKSRLLEDIEWIAQEDTPTGRKILINDKVPDDDLRFSVDMKLVAQLSQNMNFIMDMSVEEFIKMHAQSRGIAEVSKVTEKIIRVSNELAGEKFCGDTPLTSLSGGQSRALMICDTAYLSNSPIVLIDEIENAGVDRRKAIDILLKNEKIIIMATHDPILALIAERRLVIRNGGIDKIIKTTPEERENLSELEEMDKKLLSIRNKLRFGEIIDKL
jgi:ABC-type lipoprotein export system ATPase subunit